MKKGDLHLEIFQASERLFLHLL